VSAPEPTSATSIHPRIIVVPLDGSDVADAALPVAHHLAAAFRAEVQRITVRDGGKSSARVDVELEGDPAEAIVEHVATLDAPLVVLSGHGHSGWTKRLVGSVADEVVRTSAAPVVVVGPNLDRSQPLLAPRSLLVAIGPPPVPATLIPAAVGWATTLRAAVTLAHVVSPQVADVLEHAEGGEAASIAPDLDALAEQARRLGLANVSAELVVSEHPTRALVGLADSLTPPVLLVAQARAAADIEQSDQLTYKLLRHSRWPILATVGRA
jgi:nucleotide-binding universal stress UspA family protein